MSIQFGLKTRFDNGGGDQEGGCRAEYWRLLLDADCLTFVEFDASL
jgi:hypothetical protein